jgi:hypothetical protein
MSGRARNPIIIGLSFVITGIAYGVLAVPLGYHVEYAGVTLLPALGVALGILAYVLTAGSSD